jgi:hypothetical protein
MTDLDALFDESASHGRGMAQASRDLIKAMHEFAEASQPITGRGIGYKLFTRNLIPSMSTGDMAKVYRLLKIAREKGIIPWDWIVDETRQVEQKRSSWADPESFVFTVRGAYKRDFWKQQPKRVMVCSEKGTVRGLLDPVLYDLGVGFLVMHGFSSATAVHDLAEDWDGCSRGHRGRNRMGRMGPLRGGGEGRTGITRACARPLEDRRRRAAPSPLEKSETRPQPACA